MHTKLSIPERLKDLRVVDKHYSKLQKSYFLLGQYAPSVYP